MTDTPNPTHPFLPLQPQCRVGFEVWREMIGKLSEMAHEPSIGPDMGSELHKMFVSGGAVPSTRSGERAFNHMFKPHKPKAAFLARHLCKMLCAVVDTYLTGEDYVDKVTGLSTIDLIKKNQAAMPDVPLPGTRDLVSSGDTTSANAETAAALQQDTFNSLSTHVSVVVHSAVDICSALYKREYKHDLPVNNGMMAVNCVYYPAAYGMMHIHGLFVKGGQNMMLACLPEDSRQRALAALVLRGAANPEDLQLGYLTPRVALISTFEPPANNPYADRLRSPVPGFDTPGPGSGGTVH